MFRFELVRAAFSRVSLVCLVILLPEIPFSAKGFDPNTIALQTFEETKGNTTADLSKRGHKLKIEGQSKWIKGKFGGALWFDKDAFVAYNLGKAIEDFSFKDVFSFEFWLNIEAIVLQTVFGLPRKEGEYVSAFRKEAGGWWVDSYINNGGWVKITSQDISKYGEQHHYATTFDGKEVKVYIDGRRTAAGKAKRPLNKTDAPFRLSNSCCGGRSFVGAIDEMRVSKTACSEKEIRTLMGLGIEGFLAVNSKGKLTTYLGRNQKPIREAAGKSVL